MGEHNGHRDRVRKRYLLRGPENLTDQQLLEYLLFYAIPRKDTELIARNLLHHFGSLAGVMDASLTALQEVEGIGESAAGLLSLIAPMAQRYLFSKNDLGTILDSTEACGNFLLPYFFGATEELIYLLCLDAKCKVLACRQLQRGSINSATLPIRKAAELAMSVHAVSVVLAHNHTSGIAVPSQADYDTTTALREALAPLEIFVADHIIIANSDFVSLVENGFPAI